MIRKHYDKILLVSALVLLLVIFGFAAFRPDAQPITDFVDIPALRQENTFTVSEVPELDLSITQWEEPPAQSAGQEWVFDVFTPPVILFDTATNEFVLPGDDAPAPQDFGVELAGIEDELYRVQLVGYFGSGEDLLVTLENMETGEQVLAREGQEYGNFGIVVRTTRIEEVKIDHGGETAVAYEVAFVVLHDERLGQDVTLRSDERKRDTEPTAEFRAMDDPEQLYRARVGESFVHGGVTYKVEALTPPASAIVTRTGVEEGELPQTKTLRVTQPETPPSIGQSGPSTNRRGTGATPGPNLNPR